MDFLPYYDPAQFLTYSAQIKQGMENWQVVEVGVTGSHNAAYIARRICGYYKDKEGLTLICNKKTVLALVNLGKETSLQLTAIRLQERMPPQSCTVVASGVTGDGLARLQLHINETGGSADENKASLLRERAERQERIIMVVEDDMFIRSVIARTLKQKARVVELPSTEHVVDSYLEHLPDVVFLDIHLPGGSGMEVLREILSFDESAYVVIMTSDSVKDNVVSARTLGAKGFIAKNFTPEKLLEAYARCPTVQAAGGKAP